MTMSKGKQIETVFFFSSKVSVRRLSFSTYSDQSKYEGVMAGRSTRRDAIMKLVSSLSFADSFAYTFASRRKGETQSKGGLSPRRAERISSSFGDKKFS
jgi:hypothetical protein